MTQFKTKKTQSNFKYAKDIHSKTHISSLRTPKAISTEEILEKALKKLIHSPKQSLRESLLKKDSHNKNNHTLKDSNINKEINTKSNQVKLKKTTDININSGPKLITANTNCLGFDKYAATIKEAILLN